MPYTRGERQLLHNKQEKLQTSFGKPLVRDLTEGIPVLRKTSEGVVEYFRYKGSLYKKVLDRSDAVPETKENIKLTIIDFLSKESDVTIGRDLTINGKLTFAGNRVNNSSILTIYGNTLDVPSTEGPLIIVQGEGDANDDLMYMYIDSTVPPIGTELFLTRYGSNVITVKTRDHSGVADNNKSFSSSHADSVGGSLITIDTLAISDSYTILHVIYNERWVVLNSHIAASTT